MKNRPKSGAYLPYVPRDLQQYSDYGKKNDTNYYIGGAAKSSGHSLIPSHIGNVIRTKAK